MKLTLARALKEKNRIAGRLHHVQELVKKENRNEPPEGGVRRKP